MMMDGIPGEHSKGIPGEIDVGMSREISKENVEMILERFPE